MTTLHCKTLLFLTVVYTLAAFPVIAQQVSVSGAQTFNVLSRAEAYPILLLTFNKQTGQIVVNTQFDIPWKEYGIKGKRTMGMTVGDIVKVDVLITGKS
jgi:hypothetical protein